jgi:DNA-binding NarL/FixJ family response regulator
MAIKILIADDHRMFREMLRLPLQAQHDMTIVGEASTGAETLSHLESLDVDVLILDISLPDQSGIEIASRVRQDFPRVRVLALSAHTERTMIHRMLQSGACAYVVKTSGVEELLYAIRAVFRGHRFLSPEITHFLWEVPLHKQASLHKEDPLAPREREVLSLLAQGYRSLDVAGTLGIAPGTVDVHRRNIKRKLGLRTVSEMTRYAIRAGLLPL